MGHGVFGATVQLWECESVPLHPATQSWQCSEWRSGHGGAVLQASLAPAQGQSSSTPLAALWLCWTLVQAQPDGGLEKLGPSPQAQRSQPCYWCQGPSGRMVSELEILGRSPQDGGDPWVMRLWSLWYQPRGTICRKSCYPKTRAANRLQGLEGSATGWWQRVRK